MPLRTEEAKILPPNKNSFTNYKNSNQRIELDGQPATRLSAPHSNRSNH